MRANLEAGNAFEVLAKRHSVENLGEVIVESQWRQGAAMRGFDFLSYSGRGRNARLFINEAKNELGRVGSRRFTTFGLGKSGVSSFDAAFGKARLAIERAGLDPVTRRTLLSQLSNRSANVRLIGNANTIFDPKIMQRINQKTGFIVGEGFRLP